MAIVAPADCAPGTPARTYLERVVAGPSPVAELHTLDLRQSMNNGGGPACLRLRVLLSAGERAGLGARVIFDDAVDRDLVALVERRYRDRLVPADLADPLFARESLETLDEITSVLGLGAVFDFQS
jgi:succinylarginine dihydrolase